MGSRPRRDAPPPRWGLYFPDVEYADSPELRMYEQMLPYFEGYAPLVPKADLENHHAATVDFAEVVPNCPVEGLAEELREHPSMVLNCMALALHQALAGRSQGEELNERLSIMLINYEPLTPMRDIKTHLVGKFVGLHGTVVRVSNIRPIAVAGEFECNRCGARMVIRFEDGRFENPTKCETASCRSKAFTFLRGSPNTQLVDWQRIHVQEFLHDDVQDAGRVPRGFEVELSAHLVDVCVPGDIVTLCGIVKFLGTDESEGKRQRNTPKYVLYIEANSITTTRSRTSAAAKDDGSDILQFSIKDMYAIREIANEKELFKLIVNSVCPSIFAGFILALFGGRRKYAASKSNIAVRGDPHVLVVGDPGMGKSQMLQAVSVLAPRGVYVSGTTATSAGLTVAVHRDATVGDFSIEAGALVLADQGACCIDEFDKLHHEHEALLEAMEQQSISIAKAGIICSLPARASVLAAANPAGGHYNKSKTVSENLKMGGALLSRFDLIFIMLDKPDLDMDRFLSAHVMALHAGRQHNGARPQMLRSQSPDLSQHERQSLAERLKARHDQSIEPIPPLLLRKYIGYARQYVEPQMTSEAAEVLQTFYLDLRRRHRAADAPPITTRQLESLVRLAEARARLELRELVTADDARDAIELMKFSLNGTFEDSVGDVDVSRSQHGTGMTRNHLAKRFVGELERIATRTAESVFSLQTLFQVARDLQLPVPNLSEFIQTLNYQGYLLKRGANSYKLMSAPI